MKVWGKIYLFIGQSLFFSSFFVFASCNRGKPTSLNPSEHSTVSSIAWNEEEIQDSILVPMDSLHLKKE